MQRDEIDERERAILPPLRMSKRPLVVYEASVHQDGLGGARFHFIGLSAALFSRLGFTLRLVVPAFRKVASLRDSLPAGIQLVELRCGPRRAPSFLFYELKKVFLYLQLSVRSRGRPVILLTRLSYHGLSTLVARMLGWRVIVEVNGVPSREAEDRRLSKPLRWFIALASKMQIWSAQELISVTPGIAAELARPRRTPVHVIPNGVDLARFPILPRDLAESRRSMVFIGTFAPWQDVSLLLRAMRELEAENDDGPPWKLTVVGDGEQAQDLLSLAERLGLEGRVQFVGWQPHEVVSTFIARAWICVVPLRRKGGSLSCGSPLKLFEYLASNRPVVASNVDGVRELALPLIERYDEGKLSSLVDALRRASALAPLRPSMIEELRTRIAWENRAESVLTIALPPSLPALTGGSSERD